MAKKRTGLDALREYEARSGRKTQSENQQTGNAGSSGGTWRSGLDALREYEASGGGQNVKNGPYNPDYRTNTKKATPQSYEAAYQQYKQIANSINHDQLSGYLRTMQERQNQIIDSINHDQMSGYRRTLQEKDRQQQRKVQTGTAAKQAATNAGQDYSRLIGLNQFDGELERRDAEQEKRYRETVLPDKLRGMKRTSEELQKQIDQLYEQKSDEHFRDYQFGEDGTAWYTDENGTRRQARGVTDIQSEIEALETRKAALDSGRALGQAENTVGTMDTATRNLLKDINGTNLLKKTDAKHQLQQKGYSEDQIGRLAEYEKYLEDFEDYQTRMAGAQQFGRDAPVFSTVTSSLMAPFKALGNIESFRGILPKGLGGYQNPDMPTNIYSPMYAATHVSSGIRSGVMDGMGSVGQFLYQAGTSALDSAVNMAVSTAIVGTTGLSGEEASSAVAETMNWVMGSQVAADSVYAGIQSGKSNQEALIDGIVEGAIEGFTEKYSVGDIIETMLSGKQVWKKAMRAFASEGAEEIASNWLNRIYDVVAKHDRGEVMGAYAEYLSKGNTKEKALALTLADMLAEDGLSFLAGGISGLAMSGAYAGTNKAVEARSRGQQLNVIGQVMDAVESMAKERGDQATAEAAQAVMDKVKAGQMPETAEVQAVVDSAVKADQAAQAEAAFQTYNQYADERDAKARDAEKASWARSQENTEAINDAEADSAADAFEKLNEAEVKGAADARARQQTEEARAERMFTQESRDDADRLLTDAARRYGFDDRMTSVLLSGYDGEQDAQQYAEDVNAAYEYGRNGMSLSAAQRAAQGVNADVAQEAWNAGRASIQRAPMSAFERYNQYAEERDARQAEREAQQQASVQTVQAVQEAARPQQAPTQTAVQEAREAAQTAQETAPKAQETVRETAQEQTKPAQERTEEKPAKQEAQESKPQALAANQYAAREMAESVIKKYKMTVPDAVKDYSKRLDEAVAERYRLAEADGKSEESKATVSSMIASFQIGLRGIGFVSNKTNNADFLADAQAWLIGNAVAKGSYARLDAAKAFDGLGIEERTLRYAGEVYHFGDSLTQRMIREYNAQKGKNKGVSAEEYAKHVLNVFDRGAMGESLAGTKDRLLGDGMTRAAWNAGKGFINGEEAGSTAADDGGKRDAGMDSGEQAGTVAEGTGGAKTRSAKASAVAERIELENRVRAAGQPYLSGKDIGLEKGSAQRSFREAPESTWTDSMKAAAAMLRREGFKEVHFTVGAISIENQKAKVTRYADGVATGNTVWINATSKKWTVEQLANHEAFHHQIQDWPYTMDAVRQALADELGEDGIRELAQRYAEAYEGCYDGAELDAYIEEICADAYAGMDRLPEAKTQIIQKAAKRAQDAQQAAEENGGTRGPPEKYSVNEGFSKDVAEWYRDGMPEGEAFVLGSTGETLQGLGAIESDIYMNGDKINTILREHPEMTIREIQKIPELLDDPILILKSKGSGKGGNSRLVLFGSINTQDGQPVLAVLDLRPRENGFVLDDMQKVNSAYAKANPASFISQSDVLFADKKRTVPLLRRFGLTITSRELLRDGSIGSISYRGNSVNISGEKFSSIVQMGDRPMDAKFSADDTTATPQENDKTALAYFGRTYKWSETGYVLLNGARLDFSGRHEGGSGGYRSVDHRDIIDALGEDYGGGDYTGGMVRFMQEGNIRISPESGGINLAVMPTKAQMDSLSDFISKERGEVILDIDDASGNTISSTEYPRGTHANKVLQDIRNYFNDGTLPEVSNAPSVSQFRYSVAEEAAESDTEAEEAELQVEKLPQANRDQFMRFATKITDDLVTPLTAQMETLRKEMRPRVLELVDEFLENDALKRSSVEAVFTEAYDRALELNQEFSEKYAALQYAIRKTPVTFTEEDTRQIEQYDYFDEAALRKLTIKEKGGVSIGELYSDLSGMLPELFPSGIKNPAKQIMRIASVYKRISKAQALAQQVESTNPEYFRQNAYNDFLEQLRKIVPKMRTERELAQISIEEEAAMEKAAAERERRLAEEDARLAAEEAAKEPPTVYESLTMDSIPKKAQDYLRRVRGQTAAAIQQTLSMPFAARQEVLKPAIEEMMNEYLQTGRISQETVDRNFEESYRRGVEMDTEFYDQYKDVKTRLRDLKVTLSEADRADIADFDDFRRAAFGRLRIANEGGLPVDVAYKEMQQMAPELFPAGITHPADQLMRMFEVSKRIEKVQMSLDEYYGEDAEEFKRWAKNDYEASVENMLGALNVARRYAEARMRQQQARAVPTTMEEVKSLYADLKGLRRTYERAAAKNLLTAEDNSVLNRLLRGEITPEDVQGMENAQGILAMYEAKADYDAAAAKIADWRRYQKGKLREQADNLLKNAEKAKDKKAGIEYSRETMTRNVRDIFPEADAEAINKTYFEPVRTASANANKLKKKLREQVKALDLSRKARKGDAVSEAHAAQLLGEAQDNIRYLEQHPRAKDRDGKTLNEWRQIVLDLWATSPGLDRAKIENAVETFRKIYDGLFEQMNDVRIRNGYEPINYRQGYFPHFQPGTTDGILGLMGKALGVGVEVKALPTTISGLTHTFKPGITYFGNALERIGFDTAYDAVEGFDKYVEGAASVICYTDAIQKLRALAQQVRYRTSDEGLRERVDDVRARDDLTEHQKELEIEAIMKQGRFSLSNFVKELDEYTNLLANKKNRYDRNAEDFANRKVYNFLKAWQSRVAANMVAVNPASWLTNFGVITQAGAQLKTISVLKGMWQTLANIKTNDGLVEASDFLTNRAGSDPLVRTWQQSASAFLSTPMEWIDQFSAGTIVRARYMENIERGMSEETAMREADDFAANVMADRSKGAMPTIFESRNPITKMFTQFQLEVNNTYSYLFKDLPREQRKKGVRYLALALFKFLIGGFLYNELYEYLIGRRPMLDPLGIVNDTVGDLTGYELNNLVDAATGGGLIKESEPEGAIGSAENLAKNVLSELPASAALNLVGLEIDGGKLPFGSSFPDFGNIKSALKSETATPEEKWAKIGKELAKPAAYWLLPFGGGQIKKVWQGISALKRQGSYTANGRLQYPIYTDRKGDMASAVARTMLFGKSATPEAQAWVEAGFGALSEKATQTYEAMRAGGVDQRDSYELIKAMSKVKKTDTQTKEQLQMQLLNAFDIEDSGKVLYYYNMMASDKERAQIDKLLAEGADMGEYLRYLQEKSGVTGEKDADGKTISGSVKEETFALIDGLNLTPEQKTELAKEDYTTTGFEPWSGYREALKAGGDTWDAFYQNAVSAKVADGKTQEDAEKAVKSDLKSQLKEDYLGGSMPESEVSDYLQKYCGAEDEHDVYWTLEEWKGGEGWKKYGQFLDAVDKGVLADTRKVAKEYMKHGVDKGDLSSQLTKHFKEAWLAATGDEATRLKNAYISAYKAIGGDADKARDNIIKWRREANKRKGDKK